MHRGFERVGRLVELSGNLRIRHAGTPIRKERRLSLANNAGYVRFHTCDVPASSVMHRPFERSMSTSIPAGAWLG
jgi:hypothetical protein